MCIVLITTAHPDYSLILLDNRDEFILRPTSRPHWWSSHNQQILSARDLQREEQGTWMGITKTGNLAVLTNYRESDAHDNLHPIIGKMSRGGMVTAWFTGAEDESTEEFVHRLLEGEGVKGVGGFSLVCGKLRKSKQSEQELEPLAIVSNRSGSPDDVPWIAGKRGEVYGLSNTYYDDPVKMGKERITTVVEEAVKAGLGEQELVDQLFGILDTNTLPPQRADEPFEEYTYQLRKSIFCPCIGKKEAPKATPKADKIAAATPGAVLNGTNRDSEVELEQDETPGPVEGVATGIYGTQRQTILLVDWEGNVSYIERSLWDMEGNPIGRGKGDMKFDFKVEGWNGESKGNEAHPLAML
ncbi:Uncharacterized protein LSUE1_G009154 [Lachnellula suecica]|uniref:Transport and Golgi organization protein 2-like protein n=1 Tax=Lachnellula suecica TaxID=602035 RepID=A0A8T9BUM3_9HELO|nr:Uncharacterized protein LSUE1_G009154 [Lachnellula suecica]